MKNKILPFTVDELNNLLCLILCNVTKDCSITDEEGFIAKKVFNTLVDISLNETEKCRELLKAINEDNEHIENVQSQAGDIVKNILN